MAKVKIVWLEVMLLRCYQALQCAQVHSRILRDAILVHDVLRTRVAGKMEWTSVRLARRCNRSISETVDFSSTRNYLRSASSFLDRSETDMALLIWTVDRSDKEKVSI